MRKKRQPMSQKMQVIIAVIIFILLIIFFPIKEDEEPAVNESPVPSGEVTVQPTP